jgi:class 3 adenylate cyclase/CRP-like cAMP-binding protein
VAGKAERCQDNQADREVVILMTDMVQYARQSSGMCPEEIRDFLIGYHGRINELVHQPESEPLQIEPSAGDGSLVIFDKRPGETDPCGVCSRAVSTAVRLAEAIAEGQLAPTRMGILLGRIIEARLGSRVAKFGASFAVANRLEELCGYFGTDLLLDREVARYQRRFEESLVTVAKISLTSVQHPMNIFTLYMPGINGIPADIDGKALGRFIQMKNQALEFFTGNLLEHINPDFPRVREELLAAQRDFRALVGRDDVGIERILEYIRETPHPSEDFKLRGMQLLEKKRDSLGERLFHLSKQLLRALNPDYYHALVVDTGWEKYFKLEWRKQGEVIIRIGSLPDGIYYLDSGTAETLNADGELLSTMESGTIFGEMAYFGTAQRRTATVRAKSDVVLRRIATEDFKKLPVIQDIFKRIALARKEELAVTSEKE